MYSGIKINKALVGNLMVWLATECRPLYHTKLLKLLYLIDEEATRRYGSPITWLTYKAWRFGPVSQDVFYSKNPKENRFEGYVRFVHSGEKVIVEPVAAFDDSEFSEMDMEVIRDVVARYGNCTSSKLVSVTHAKDSLWHKTVEENGIRFSEENRTSDVEIDFSDLVEHDGMKKTIFYSALEGKWLDSGI